VAEADYPADILLRPGRLNRLTVFFRLILAIPAGLLTALVIFGMELLANFDSGYRSPGQTLGMP
jgi:hypothetical protein